MVELVVPLQLRFQLQFATPEHGHVERADVAPRLEVGALGSHPFPRRRQRGPACLHQTGEFFSVAGAAEHQGDPQGVGAVKDLAERLFAQDVQLPAPFAGNLVDGACGAPADLLGAQRLHQALLFHQPQLAVERADVDAAPGADVGLFGVAADLVAVPRDVVGQQPQDHEPGKIHAISFRRLIAGVKRVLEKMG